MTIEYLPNGVACDLSCKYCYQQPMRDAGNISSPLSFARVKETLIKQGAEFSVFGGEALLTPKPKLREIFKFGLEQFGRNSIQTNCLKLDEDHIELFKKYKVGVGVSIDGWEDLNSPRSDRVQTDTIIQNIKKLVNERIIPSLIITIHRANAKKELLDFLYWVKDLGITHVNLHILETDSKEVQANLELSNLENFGIFSMIYDEFKDTKLFINPFNDIIELLTKENPQVICTWNACDAINTLAVQGVGPDGSLINCGRTNKDGVNWLKAKSSGKERYLALYNTPLEFGGCKDCRYFFACKGQCPGTAIDGDWRNKTAHCDFWYSLIEHIWQDLAVGGTQVFNEAQMRSMGARFIQTLSSLPNNHGDTPHGDSHGDHTDSGSNSKGIPVTWIDSTSKSLSL
jgi:uncharacterized protein